MFCFIKNDQAGCDFQLSYIQFCRNCAVSRQRNWTRLVVFERITTQKVVLHSEQPELEMSSSELK